MAKTHRNERLTADEEKDLARAIHAAEAVARQAIADLEMANEILDNSPRRTEKTRAGSVDRLEAAVEKVLADGVRTADLLGEEGVEPVSTSQMGDAVIAALEASL